MSSKTKVFIDAENVSPTEFDSKYKKKIRRFAKNHGISVDNIEFRAYAVDGGPASGNWKSDGVSMKRIPGSPAKDKADKVIAKELYDQVDKNSTCLLVTHDKGLQSRVNNALIGVYIFDK